MIEAPPAVVDLVRRLERAGYETWTVGGAVRDALRRARARTPLPPGTRPRAQEDWDLATRATPQRVMRIFRRTVPVGIRHGTVGVFGHDGVLYEVTTFRRDVIAYGRRAKVAFASTLDEDLARRDFTINAIAWHPLRRELRDPYGGARDLGRGLLRTVGKAEERFREDYLRVLRGLRFAGTIGLDIVDETWEALVAAVPGLGRLSRERVREELLKVLAARAPSRSLELYERSGARAGVLPELPRGLGRDARRVVDAVRGSRRADLRLAALLIFGLGLPDRAAAESADARGARKEASFRAASDILAGLRCSNAERRRIGATVAAAADLAPPARLAADAAARRRWLAQTGPLVARDAGRIWLAALRARTTRHECGAPRQRVLRVVGGIRADLRSKVPLTVQELALSGRDLLAMGWAPGPEVGRVLHRLLEAVWQDPEVNRGPALARLAHLYGPGAPRDGDAAGAGRIRSPATNVGEQGGGAACPRSS